MNFPLTRRTRYYNKLPRFHGLITTDVRADERVSAPIPLHYLYAWALRLWNWCKGPNVPFKYNEAIARMRQMEKEMLEERRKRLIYQYRLDLHGITTEVGDECP